MKDNEFKARNKDTDFSKKVEADTVGTAERKRQREALYFFRT